MKYIKWILLSVVLILFLGIGIWVFRNHPSAVAAETQKKADDKTASDDKKETESADTTEKKDTEATTEKKEKPVAKVSVTPLKESKIEEQITLYGTIVAASQQLQTYNVPFECQVKQIHVTLGQIVNKGDTLVDIEPSLAELLELKQARNDVQASQDTLKKVQEKFDLKLITRQDLLTAQQAVQQAKIKLENLIQEGIESQHKIKATNYGIVNQLDIQNGQIIPGNTVLVAIANNNSLEARLGIDGDKANSLQAGQSVLLSLVNRPTTNDVKGTVRLMTHKINPDTRLVDFYVSLPPKNSFLMSDYVTGKITLHSAKGFVVPRDAVLPDEEGYVMYTVDKEKAVLHHVQIGIETDKEIQVIGKDLKAGQSVVIQGNYELEDGMKVDTSETK